MSIVNEGLSANYVHMRSWKYDMLRVKYMDGLWGGRVSCKVTEYGGIVMGVGVVLTNLCGEIRCNCGTTLHMKRV